MIQRISDSLSTTCHVMNGGVDAVYGVGEDFLLTFGTTFSAFDFNYGDRITFLFTDEDTSYQTQIGSGYVTGKQFTYVMTFKNKIYGLAGGSAFCSALYSPLIWNDPNSQGNGFVTMSNWYGKSEVLTAVAPYQGRLAFFSANTTQIWQVDTDMNNWQLQQVMPNFGTEAPLTVQNFGELDVIFLSQTGIRSLRTRVSSLNAYVTDIGSPVDSLVVQALQKDVNAPNINPATGACSIIDPKSSRYWCYIPSVQQKVLVYNNGGGTDRYNSLKQFSVDTGFGAGDFQVIFGTNERSMSINGGGSSSFSKVMYSPDGIIKLNGSAINALLTVTIYSMPVPMPAYVLSQYPSNKILAWSQYLMTDDSGTGIARGAAIIPQKFVVFNGEVYFRDETGIFKYGLNVGNYGFHGQTGYDNTQCVVSTPWLDLNTPGTRKTANSIDSAFQGTWTFYAGMDQLHEQLDYVWEGNQPTFQLGTIGYTNEGTHFRFKAVSAKDLNNPANIASLIVHYTLAGEK